MTKPTGRAPGRPKGAMNVELRLEAAGKAIRYEKPALVSVDLTSMNEHHVCAVSAEPLSLEEWEAQHCGGTGKPQ